MEPPPPARAATPATPAGPPREADRGARLKAALKANVARRKAQARARGAGTAGADRREAED
jgi:hypothetical protein